MIKVKLFIPVNTTEQRVVRDEIAKSLASSYEAVTLTFTEVCKIVEGKPYLFPTSIIEVYVKELPNEELNYFKELSNIISEAIGDSVVLEVIKQTTYIGTTITSTYIGKGIKED